MPNFVYKEFNQESVNSKEVDFSSISPDYIEKATLFF